MKSTALGAENIIFISDAHEKFYYEKLQEVRYQDVYHKALCYCLGINGDTLVKRNIEYDCLVQRCRLGEQQQLDEIVALIVETISIEQSKSYEETKELCETLEKEMISLMSPDLQAMFEDYKEYTLNLKQTEQRDAYIDGLAFGIRTISEAFLHENKNRIW